MKKALLIFVILSLFISCIRFRPTTPGTDSKPETDSKILGFGVLSDIAISPDGSKLASSSRGMVFIWDLQTGDTLMTLKGHTNRVNSVSWSPDGNMLASGSKKEIKLWDINTGKEIKTLKGHTDDVNSVSWSPDGNMLASGSYDGTVRIWYLETEEK